METRKSGNYVMGIIGAIIGGIIGAVPWVIAYVYGGVILWVLAVLIAGGEWLGYKIFKGKKSKAVPAIIMVIAIIIITLTTLLVIPAILISKENLIVNMNSLKNAYSYNEFASGIIRDWIISLAFTVIGAGVITKNIKKEMIEATDKDGKKLVDEELDSKIKQDAIKLIKPIFKKYNATSEDNTLTKEEVFAEIEEKNIGTYFAQLKKLDILKKVQGRYYYCEENETNNIVKQSYGTMAIVGVCVIFAVVIASLMYSVINKPQTTTKVWNDDVSYEITSGWNLLEDYSEEKGWTYYQRLESSSSSSQTNTEGANSEASNAGNTEKTNTETANAENTIDYTQYPETLTISYDSTTGENTVSNVDELKEMLETYIKERLLPEQYYIETMKTDKGYDAVKAKLHYTSDPEEVDYIYYIYNNGKIAYFTGATFNMNNDEELETQMEKILNSFEWVK